MTPELIEYRQRLTRWTSSLKEAINAKTFFGKPRFSISEILLIMEKEAEANGSFWRKIKEVYPQEGNQYPRVSADFNLIIFKP